MTGIAIAGFGTVGQGIWQILHQQQASLAAALGQAPEVRAILVRDKNKPRETRVPEALFTEDLATVLDDPAIQVVLEATGDVALGHRLATGAMERGKHVVTASKALVSAHMEQLHALAAEKGVHFLYEASVGGGTPLIKPLKDLPSLGQISALRGIINGSCNYILDAMSTQNRDAQQVIQEAQALGYLEAQPEADLLGWDARRKLRILATLAFGGTVLEEDIPCLGISRVTQEDMQNLKQRGLTVKLLGTATRAGQQITAHVFPWALPQEDQLAGVGGAYNYVEVQGQYIDKVGFFGSGAGRYPTAHAMVNDLVDVLLHRQPLHSPLKDERLPLTRGEELATFYLRGLPKDAATIQEQWGTGMLTWPTPLKQVLQLLDSHPTAAAILVSMAD